MKVEKQKVKRAQEDWRVDEQRLEFEAGVARDKAATLRLHIEEAEVLHAERVRESIS